MFAWILFYLLVLFVAAWSSPKSHKVFVGLHWIVCLAWCQVKQTIINFNPICIIPIRNSTTWSINGRDQFTNSFKFVRETLLKKVQLGELLIAQIFKLFWYPSLKPPSIHPINWKGFCFTTSTLQNHCMYSKCALLPWNHLLYWQNTSSGGQKNCIKGWCEVNCYLTALWQIVTWAKTTELYCMIT